MGIDIQAEFERAKFLDWIDNNKKEILDYLILEYEDLLIELYSAWGRIGYKCQGCGYVKQDCICSENIEER